MVWAGCHADLAIRPLSGGLRIATCVPVVFPGGLAFLHKSLDINGMPSRRAG